VRNGHGARTEVILSEVLAQPLTVLTNTGLIDEIGRDNVFDSLDAALERASDIAALRPTTDTHGAVSAGNPR